MLVARGETCLFMDADGATRITDLEALELALARVQATSTSTAGSTAAAAAVGAAAAAGAAGAVQPALLGAAFGSRSHMEAAAMAKRHPMRNFLTRGVHALVTLVAGGRIKDTQCGFKVCCRGGGGGGGSFAVRLGGLAVVHFEAARGPGGAGFMERCVMSESQGACSK